MFVKVAAVYKHEEIIITADFFLPELSSSSRPSTGVFNQISQTRTLSSDLIKIKLVCLNQTIFKPI